MTAFDLGGLTLSLDKQPSHAEALCYPLSNFKYLGLFCFVLFVLPRFGLLDGSEEHSYFSLLIAVVLFSVSHNWV